MRYDRYMKAFWRFVTNLVMVALALVILPGFILLLTREIFIWNGIQSLKKDLRELNRLSSEKNCETEYGSVMAEGEQMYRQVRFVDSRTYELELICPGFPDHPLAQKEKMLSSFVSKMPGSAGILQRDDAVESFVGIAVFQALVKGLPEDIKPYLSWLSRGELVGLAAGEIVTKPVEKDQSLSAATVFGLGPTSTCEGYGFSCCDGQREYGMGDTISDVPSCPANCYSRCLARPLIVSWRSNPMPDWETNTLELPSGGSAELYYVIEDSTETAPWTATIQFGDGQQTVVSGKEGTVSHTYLCASERCEYTATVVVENGTGARSAETDISKLKILVGTPLETAPVSIEPDRYYE